ncbi:UROD/MetE-like protein [Corynespora cassiicola Philippines]|uniref:UROD/MetE-like protein n=1 Tax=Corynespora cassiicola Philippines TaxID=1448308 RepID=A0A2T2P6L2_CORCC|nr:UROD/MetE-like protein [Corynespora cassiicola Philippines]
MAPIFRAEHIGSLIRPATIVDNAASSGGGVGLKERSDAVSAAVRDVIQTQIKHSITPLTHGEYPRRNFFAVLFDQLEGFEYRPTKIPDGFRAEIPVVRGAAASGLYPVMPSPVATGPIRWVKPALAEEWQQIQDAVRVAAGGDEAKAEELLSRVKLTIPSPIVHHIRLKRGTAYTPGSGYKNDAEFFADLTKAYRQELKSLYDLGCRYVQVDDPDLTYFCDEDFLRGLKEDGVDPDELLDTYVKAHNEFLKGRPEDLTMGVHLCRGNLTDELWLAKGSYERIAQRLFNELEYDAFFLEYETEKAGSFEPLRFLPTGKVIVLGVVSTKTPELEDLGVLEKKVREAAAVIADANGITADEVLENQLAVSPQCGFASAEHKKAVGSEEKMWDKLLLVRDLAQQIWPNAK